MQTIPTQLEEARRAKALELAVQALGPASSVAITMDAPDTARSVLVLASAFEEWLAGLPTDSAVRTARMMDEDATLGQGDQYEPDPASRASIGQMLEAAVQDQFTTLATTLNESREGTS